MALLYNGAQYRVPSVVPERGGLAEQYTWPGPVFKSTTVVACAEQPLITGIEPCEYIFVQFSDLKLRNLKTGRFVFEKKYYASTYYTAE